MNQTKHLTAEEFIKEKLIVTKEDWLREMESYSQHINKELIEENKSVDNALKVRGPGRDNYNPF